MKDRIYLLSTEEYEKYEDRIPLIKDWWWLRSTGNYQSYAAYVYSVGSVRYYGYGVNHEYNCVRPVLDISNINASNLKFIDNKLIHCGVTWIKIDKNLYISEMPIAYHRFDGSSNDYKTSEIRQFLLDWYKERKNW